MDNKTKKRHKKQATSKRPIFGKEGSVLEKRPKNKKNKKGLYSLKTDKPKKEGSVLERRTKEERQQDRYTSLKAKGKHNKAEDYKEKKNLADDGSKGRKAVEPYAKKGNVKKAGKLKQEMRDGEDTLQTMKKGYVKKEGPVKKTVARVARDYAANAAYDAEHGYKKEAKFEKKKLMHVVNRIAGAKNR